MDADSPHMGVNFARRITPGVKFRGRGWQLWFILAPKVETAGQGDHLLSLLRARHLMGVARIDDREEPLADRCK